MTTEVNFTRKRGDSYPILVTVQDSAGAAVDITGATFKLTVDPSESPTDNTGNLFQSTGSIVAALSGTVTFPITPANADRVGVTYYDVQMIDTNSIVTTILKGSITWEQDITKDTPP